MNSDPIIPDYRALNPLTQKPILAYQFSSAAGIGPQIRSLLQIDRLPALKYLAICRTMLYDSFTDQLLESENKKKSTGQVFDQDLIREVNLNTEPFRNQKIEPANEDPFFGEVNAIIRLSLLFIYEELIASNKKKYFLEGIKKMGESLEFIFSGDSDKKVFGEFDRFVAFALNDTDNKSISVDNNDQLIKLNQRLHRPFSICQT